MDCEKLFVEKLTILNDNFVRFIQRAHREHPTADFSPTVQDYLKYVGELDSMYYVKGENSISTVVNPSDLCSVETTVSKSNDVAASFPVTSKLPASSFLFGALTSSEKALENGDSCISKTLAQPVSFQEIVSKGNDTGNAASSPTISKVVSAPISFGVSKSNESTEKANASPSAAKRPAGTFLFGTQKTGEKTEKDVAPWAAKTTVPGFSFGGNATKQNGNSDDASSSAAKRPASSFSFGVHSAASSKDENGGAEKNDSSTPTAVKRSAPPLLFGSVSPKEGRNAEKSADAEPSAVKTTTFLFGSVQNVSLKGGNMDAPTSSPSAPKRMAPTFSFGVAASKSNENVEKADASSSAAKRPAGTFLFGTQKTGEKTEKDVAPWAAKTTVPGFSFGGNATKQNGNSDDASTVKSSVPTFTFSAPSAQQPSATSTSENNDDSGGEQEEPPKPETVDHSEEGAICSVKCACFHLVDGEYKKLGVAFASIKSVQDADGKGERKQLIVRASNTLGNVWTNTYIDDKFQWQKAKDKNLRISYPKTEDGGTPSVTTILLRVGSEEDEKKLTDVFEKK